MPNEPHQRNYLHGSFETPSTIPPTNPTKTKPLTPKESKSLCLTNMLRSCLAKPHATAARNLGRYVYANEEDEGFLGWLLRSIPKDQKTRNLVTYLATHLATKTKQPRDIASGLRTFGGR